MLLPAHMGRSSTRVSSYSTGVLSPLRISRKYNIYTSVPPLLAHTAVRQVFETDSNVGTHCALANSSIAVICFVFTMMSWPVGAWSCKTPLVAGQRHVCCSMWFRSLVSVNCCDLCVPHSPHLVYTLQGKLQQKDDADNQEPGSGTAHTAFVVLCSLETAPIINQVLRRDEASHLRCDAVVCQALPQ